MYQWLLFDADNTLFDFSKAEAKSFHLTCNKFNIPFTPRVMAQYKAINIEAWHKFELGEITSEQINNYRFGTLFNSVGHNGNSEGKCYSTYRIYIYTTAASFYITFFGG